MKVWSIVIISAVVLVCVAGILTKVNLTGYGTYDKTDAQLGGANIAGTANWEDYPGHKERHEAEKLADSHTNYWWCNSYFNCSVTATFEDPEIVNEIHIHACYINKEKYIPKMFSVELNSSDGWYSYKIERNNTYVTDYKISFPEPKIVSGVRVSGMHGKDINGIGDYDYPCLEELEIYRVKDTDVAPPAEPQAEEEMSFWQRLNWLLFGE